MPTFTERKKKIMVLPCQVSEVRVYRYSNNFGVYFPKIFNPITKCYDFSWTYKGAKTKSYNTALYNSMYQVKHAEILTGL